MDVILRFGEFLINAKVGGEGGWGVGPESRLIEEGPWLLDFVVASLYR